MSNETTGPDWQALTEATREAVEKARAALDELARVWNAATYHGGCFEKRIKETK